jgi:hypothetical protein
MRAFILTAVLLLVGCQDRYRYPCQDPTNWDSDICKKPICEINRSCPEHIFKEDKKDCKP